MAISTIGGSTAAASGEYGGQVLAAGQVSALGGKIAVPGGLPAGNYILEFRGSPTQTHVYTYAGTVPSKITQSPIYTYSPNGYSNGVPAEANLITVPANCDGIYIPAGYVGAVILRSWTPATAATLTEQTFAVMGAMGSRTFTQAGYAGAYGNNRWITIDYSSSSALSNSTDNGATWNLNAYVGYGYSIAFGNNIFVIAYNGYQYAKVSTTTDGNSVTERSLPTTTYWNWVHYAGSLANPRFVVTGSDSNACISTDGITWTAANIGSGTGGAYVVRDGGGVAVAMRSGSATYYTSTDLVNWTSRTFPTTISNPSLAYSNGLFLMSPGGANYYTSPDGINWTTRTSPFSNLSNGVVATNGVFMLGPINNYNGTVATNGYSTAWLSNNGTAWTARAIAYGPQSYIPIAGNSLFMGLPYGNSQGGIRTAAAMDSLT
jgi:hypothetical protein